MLLGAPVTRECGACAVRSACLPSDARLSVAGNEARSAMLRLLAFDLWKLICGQRRFISPKSDHVSRPLCCSSTAGSEGFASKSAQSPGVGMADVLPPPAREPPTPRTNADFRALLDTPRANRGGQTPARGQPKSGPPKKRPPRPQPYNPTAEYADEGPLYRSVRRIWSVPRCVSAISHICS